MSRNVNTPRRRVSPSSVADRRKSSSLWLALASTPAYCQAPTRDGHDLTETAW